MTSGRSAIEAFGERGIGDVGGVRAHGKPRIGQWRRRDDVDRCQRIDGRSADCAVTRETFA